MSMHDPYCAASWQAKGLTGPCTCSTITLIRAHERELVAERLGRAQEHVVKIGGISTAVIQRGTAIATALEDGSE